MKGDRAMNSSESSWKRAARLALSAAMLAGGTQDALGAVFERTESGSFFWSDRWSPNGIPGPDDTIRLTGGARYERDLIATTHVINRGTAGYDVTEGRDVTNAALVADRDYHLVLGPGSRTTYTSGPGISIDPVTYTLTDPLSVHVYDGGGVTISGGGAMVTGGDIRVENAGKFRLYGSGTELTIGDDLLVRGSTGFDPSLPFHNTTSTARFFADSGSSFTVDNVTIGFDSEPALLAMRGGDGVVRGALHVGDDGPGSLSIENGSRLTAAVAFLPSASGGGSAAARISDGELAVGGGLGVGQVGEATIEIGPSGRISAGSGIIGGGATLRVRRTASSRAVPTLDVSGSLTITSAATLSIEISDARPGDVFEVIRAGSVHGAFGQVTVSGVSLPYTIDTSKGVRIIVPGTPPPGTGACCLTGGCEGGVTSQACSDRGGTYRGDGSTCDECPSPPETGACCFDGVCEELTLVECRSVGGALFRGYGTSCADAGVCTREPGACCLPNGGCQDDVDPHVCQSDLGGVFKGERVACAQVENCVDEHFGACCLGSGCQDRWERQCRSLGGTFGGGGRSCAEFPSICSGGIGACCFGADVCQDNVTRAECVGLGGVYRGDTSWCDRVACYETDLTMLGEGLALYAPAAQFPWGWIDRGTAGVLEPHHGYQWGLAGDRFLGGEPYAPWTDRFGEPVSVRAEGGFLSWYVLLNDEIRFSHDAYFRGSFGLAGDRPVIGRFFADGFDRAAVLRGASELHIDGDRNLVWSAGADPMWQLSVAPLAPSDEVLAGHIVGSALDDLVVWREAGALGWFQVHENISGGLRSQISAHIQFGLAGDIPVIGDVNGDGRDDVLVYRPSVSKLYVNLWEAEDPWPGLADGDVDYEVDYGGVTGGAVWDVGAYAFDFDGPQTAFAERNGGCPDVELLFVDADAIGARDGSSWDHAFTDLQDALDAARDSCARSVEIWVAEGRYRPDRGTGDRSRSFDLPNGVRLYGGFAGVESARDERDPVSNETVLSGDLAGNEDGTFEGRRENSYSIIRAIGVDRSGVIDGFTISDSYDNQSDLRGGGIEMTDSSLLVRDVTFADNWAGSRGGAVSIVGGSPVFERCVFLRNATTSGGWGGAVSVHGAGLLLSRCEFHDGLSLRGGAIAIERDSDVTLSETVFVGNTAYDDGGAIACFDSMLAASLCVFAGNEAQSKRAGAVYLGRSVAYLTGSRFVDNVAPQGGAIWAGQTAIEAEALVLESNHATGEFGMAGDGGGFYAKDGSDLTLLRSTLRGNLADRGGAVATLRAHATIVASALTGNFAASRGGAAQANDSTGGVTLVSCLIESNAAPEAAATSVADGGAMELVHCTVAHNLPDLGAAAIDATGGSTAVRGSIVWANTVEPTTQDPAAQLGGTAAVVNSIVDSGIDAGTTGSGPLFRSGDAGDYELAEGSAAIDAGAASALGAWSGTDVLGNPRVVDAESYGPDLVDLGAFEAPAGIGVGDSSSASCAGDIDGDGITSLADFSIFASNFGSTVSPGAGGDMDGDGQVTLSDFSIFASDFGCTED